MHSLNPKYAVMYFAGDETVYLIGRVIGVLSPESIAMEEDVIRYQEIHNLNYPSLICAFIFIYCLSIIVLNSRIKRQSHNLGP